jgi:hypothetical protein
MFHTLPFVSIVVSSSGVLFGGRVRSKRSLYLEITRTKKFASKPKLEEVNMYVLARTQVFQKRDSLYLTKVAKAVV